MSRDSRLIQHSTVKHRQTLTPTALSVTQYASLYCEITYPTVIYNEAPLLLPVVGAMSKVVFGAYNALFGHPANADGFYNQLGMSHTIWGRYDTSMAI